MEKQENFSGWRNPNVRRLLPAAILLCLFLSAPIKGYAEDRPMPETVQQPPAAMSPVEFSCCQAGKVVVK